LNNDTTAEVICWAIHATVAIYNFNPLLPYPLMFLALRGAWHLWQQYLNHKHRKF
jgi:hypothetical protein